MRRGVLPAALLRQGEHTISDFITIDGLTKHYPVETGPLGVDKAFVHALEGVSLAIRRGETLGLVGESGCGKSTLARLLLRLERPTSGTIRLEGQDVWAGDRAFLKAFPRKMQMVFQDPFSSLNPRKRIGSTIGEALAIHGMPRSERKARVQELLGYVGLRPELASRYPHEFSGGQRQRVAIARALALNPDCVVCDEPVSALDVSIQAQVIGLLQDLQAEFDLTYLFISHDLSVVSYISDRVAVMYLGHIVELSPSGELYDAPLHPYTQALLEAVPVPDPEHGGMKLAVQGDIPSPISPPPGCPFHPRCLRAMDICRRERPRLAEHSAGHAVACHLY